MKILLFLLLMLACNNVSAQKIIKSEQITEHSLHITGDKFQGVIFSEKYIPGIYFVPDSFKRFSPNLQDIIQAEKIIGSDVKLHLKAIINSKFICKHVNKYYRQYAGFITPKGDKILLISFLWSKDIKQDEKLDKQIPGLKSPDWKKEWLFINDGGSYFWNIKVNLSTGKLFDFEVNGVA